MKLGIVGSGIIVKEFLSIARHLKHTMILSLCCTKRSEDEARALAKEYLIGQIFTDYEEFLRSEADTVYLGLPNHLHFTYTYRALMAGKNVIVEKPFTPSIEQALVLSRTARENRLFLFEAVTTLYQPDYRRVKDLLPALGSIRLVQCSYSQYSRRYDRFKNGEVLPAFDPACAGGALMDINIYNVHYTAGLFGMPESVHYFANIERGIDTSGVLLLDYGSFLCSLTGAKDCSAPNSCMIQGDKGYLIQNSPANICKGVRMVLNDGAEETVVDHSYSHRMISEFLEFEKMIFSGDLETCYRYLDHSLCVCTIQTEARRMAGIVFPAEVEEAQ
ncbi:gfo/Idh/MocA family oxidoreductase [Lacrimispora amygdalina]|uniref:Gfo/Idh/MocA family oxidoreductase n=1 Tax=Lacrimispora amygdalina TaxID=253257 RepID=A0A3E2ND15_9FIRM|nr:Gfo/Idh/MocA family oxidoreductase [Clostridium indicum]RFZ78892.1 gfo/Idh/MocA family oxidoreductase [Clostridium indicum]